MSKTINDIKQEKEAKTSKVAKKQAREKTSGAKESFVRGTLGVSLLLVFGSIIYSTITIVGGTDGWGPIIGVAPIALFGGFLAFVAFSKILK